MTFDLPLVGVRTGATLVAQVAADLGVQLRVVSTRLTTMEIFAVNVVTFEVDQDAAAYEAARGWLVRRGLHPVLRAA